MNKKLLVVSLLSLGLLIGCGTTKPTETPATDAPTQEATTAAPTTQAPTTQAPTTQTANTEAPTDAPSNEGPGGQEGPGDTGDTGDTNDQPGSEPTTNAPSDAPTQTPTETPSETPTEVVPMEPVVPSRTVKTTAELQTALGAVEVSAVTEAAEFTVDADAKKITLSTKEATYTIKGYFEGVIEVTGQKVVVNMENACVYNPAGSAINYTAAKKNVKVVSVENTTNYIISGVKDSEGEFNAIESANNVKFGGAGTLNLTAYNGRAVNSDDCIEIQQSTINVESKGDNFHGKTFVMVDGAINSYGAADVIDAGMNSKGEKGTVTIVNADIKADNCENVVKAEGSFKMGVAYDDDPDIYEVKAELPISIVASNVSGHGVETSVVPTRNENAVIKINGQDYVYVAPPAAE